MCTVTGALAEEGCELCPELQLAASHSPGVKRLVPARSQEEEAADHFERILSTLSDSEDVMEALSLRSFYSVTGHPLLEKDPQQKVAVCGDCVGSASDLW